MIHRESWHIEAELDEDQRTQLIERLQNQEINLEEFYSLMKQEDQRKLLEENEKGWLVFTQSWISVHQNWLSERLDQGTRMSQIEEQLPAYPPEVTASREFVYWYQMFLEREPTGDPKLERPFGMYVAVGNPVLAAGAASERPTVTGDEDAFNNWFLLMLGVGKGILEYLEKAVQEGYTPPEPTEFELRLRALERYEGTYSEDLDDKLLSDVKDAQYQGQGIQELTATFGELVDEWWDFLSDWIDL